MNEINAETHHTVIDVDFEDIVRNPVGVIKAFYALIPGMEFSPELEQPLLSAFKNSKGVSDSYRGYHGFPLKPSSIAHIRKCEKEIAALLTPITVEKLAGEDHPTVRQPAAYSEVPEATVALPVEMSNSAELVLLVLHGEAAD
eukprot:scaffold66556_cov79-Phaeocystis_antarctica.AAC.1